MPHVLDTIPRKNIRTKVNSSGQQEKFMGRLPILWLRECPVYRNEETGAFYWVVMMALRVSANSIVRRKRLYQLHTGCLQRQILSMAGLRLMINIPLGKPVDQHVYKYSLLSPFEWFWSTGSAVAWRWHLVYKLHGGCRITAATQIALLWKNDMGWAATALTEYQGQAYCMAFFRWCAFKGGYRKNDAGKYVAKYWKISGGSVGFLHAVRRHIQWRKLTELQFSVMMFFLVGTATNPDTRARKAKCWRSYQGFVDSPSSIYLPFTVPGGHETPMGFFI